MADIEAALIGAAAIEIAAAGHGNDTAVRLDHRRQWTPAPKIAAIVKLAVNIGV
ncbi:MAG: hypothetical protein VCE75_22885 [Alphaproteobacteria bacterium]